MDHCHVCGDLAVAHMHYGGNKDYFNDVIDATDVHDQVFAVTPAKPSSDEQPKLARIRSIGANQIRTAPLQTQTDDHASTVGKL